MDFPIPDLMDQEGCCQKLFDLLHPEGFACPRCAAREGLNVHRRHPDDSVVDYRCKACRRSLHKERCGGWLATFVRAGRSPCKPSPLGKTTGRCNF